MCALKLIVYISKYRNKIDNKINHWRLSKNTYSPITSSLGSSRSKQQFAEPLKKGMRRSAEYSKMIIVRSLSLILKSLLEHMQKIK